MSQQLNQLRRGAVSIGSNMSAVCRMAGVSRQTVLRAHRGELVGDAVFKRLDFALREIARQRMKSAQAVLAARQS